MANDKKFITKNGLQTQNINFLGVSDSDSISVSMLPGKMLAFSGTNGQLFSITDSATGTIFSVNDISGVPSIEVDDDGTIRLAELFGNVLVGTNSDDGINKFQVLGPVSITGNLTASVFTGPLTGNASTATTLQTARNIAVSGDITGSASFNGSANISITSTLASNVVTADKLAVTGNGTVTQYLRSDSDGTFTWDTPAGGGSTYTRTLFTATAAQTTFTVSYTIGLVDVYMNGVKLFPGTDYTASTGTSIVLASGASVNDVVEVIAWSAFEVADAVALTSISSQVEAETGTDNTKWMTPLRTAQAIDAQVVIPPLYPGVGGSTFPVGCQILAYGWGNGTLFSTRNAAASPFNTMHVPAGAYVAVSVNYGVWQYISRVYAQDATLVVRIS